MHDIITRMAILTGIVFGIFFTISCATAEKTGSSAPSAEHINRFDEQLSSLNQLIQTDPENQTARIEMAEILYEYAASRPDPESRKLLYENLRNTADESRLLPGTTSKIDEILRRAWNTEQANGIRLLQEDRSETYDIHFSRIIAHFDNAITIIPDSLVTYSLKSTTLYRRGHLNEAIQTLSAANEIANETNPAIREKLAFLHLETGNNAEAIAIYSDLTNEFPQKNYYRNGLINALIVNNEHIEAVNLLRVLSEEFPARTIYKTSLATELFFIFSNRTDLLIGNPPPVHILQDEVQEALTILDESLSIFSSLGSQLPSNEENSYRMGSFYLNASKKLYELSKLVPGDEFSNDLQARSKDYLESALPFWERLAEMTADNMEYMSILHGLYLGLGMDEEAESVERTFNF